jgi:hypothetical protein
MGRIGKDVGQSSDQGRTEVFVKQELHAGWGVARRSRSRSAALGKTSKNVFPLEVGEIGEDFLDAHVLARFDRDAGMPVGRDLNLRWKRHFSILVRRPPVIPLLGFVRSTLL